MKKFVAVLSAAAMLATLFAKQKKKHAEDRKNHARQENFF